jgi:hypothetical protein
MLRYFSLPLVLLAALRANPVSAASTVSAAAQPEMETGPPEDMIDFLGRRRECSGFAPEPGEVLPAPPAGSWREWLRCEALPTEELALRRRYKSDARAIAFLDEAPSDFRLETITVDTYDGPPRARVERSEQRGLDADGRIPWQMILDRQPSEGRATAVTVSWANHPSRTIYLDDDMFPWLDLSSAWTALGERPREALSIQMRYGWRRGWCGHGDPDDRARVSVYFTRQGAVVFRQIGTNCNANVEELEPGAFVAPPPVRRR